MTNTDTGIRGYLKWLQRDQPGIYARVAPYIVQQAPAAFSDHEQSQAMGSLMGLADGTTTTFDTTDMFGNQTAVTYPGSDVASAANSGAADPSTTSIIANLVSAVGQAYMTKQQLDLLNKVNNIQLTNAQLGLPQMDLSTLHLGLPQVGVNVGLSGSTLTAGGIALGVAALIGLAMLSGGKRKRA